MRYRAQCAFCPSGCVVSSAQVAESWKRNHEKTTDHVVATANVRL